MAKIDIKKYVNICLVKRGLNFSKLAELTGQTQPNLANKFKRSDFRISELEMMADTLDADLQIQFIDRQTGQPL